MDGMATQNSILLWADAEGSTWTLNEATVGMWANLNTSLEVASDKAVLVAWVAWAAQETSFEDAINLAFWASYDSPSFSFLCLLREVWAKQFACSGDSGRSASSPHSEATMVAMVVATGSACSG